MRDLCGLEFLLAALVPVLIKWLKASVGMDEAGVWWTQYGDVSFKDLVGPFSMDREAVDLALDWVMAVSGVVHD